MKQLMDEKVWGSHHLCALSSPGHPASVMSLCLIIWSCLIAYHTESGVMPKKQKKLCQASGPSRQVFTAQERVRTEGSGEKGYTGMRTQGRGSSKGEGRTMKQFAYTKTSCSSLSLISDMCYVYM